MLTNTIKPKKSLGQNFLIDKNIAHKIVKQLDCRQGDNIIEIGPGTGALTQILCEHDINIKAIDIDKRSIEVLEKMLPRYKYPNLELICMDVRDFNFVTNSTNQNKKFKIIGNIPYNISSDIFFMLFENSAYIDKAILMVQKDVAKRLIAKTRTKDYGILTLALQLSGDCKILFDVPPTCFYPKPNVMSSIIEIEFRKDHLPPEKFKKILELIRASFNQRRKTLKNALNNYIQSKTKYSPDEFIELAGKNGLPYFSQRAEELTKDDYIKLYQFFFYK